MKPYPGLIFLQTLKRHYMVKGVDHCHEMDCICEVTELTADDRLTYRVVSIRQQRDIPPLLPQFNRPLPTDGGMTVAEFERLLGAK
jgi:hypothetical protein